MNLPDNCPDHRNTPLVLFKNRLGWIFLQCKVCAAEASRDRIDKAEEERLVEHAGQMLETSVV